MYWFHISLGREKEPPNRNRGSQDWSALEKMEGDLSNLGFIGHPESTR